LRQALSPLTAKLSRFGIKIEHIWKTKPMKSILIGLTVALIAFSCNKNPKNFLQARLDSGESPEILLNDFPVDSFYGKYYQSGLIIHIDEDDGSGIIADMNDYPTYASWGCAGTTIVGADDSEIGDGLTNTNAILDQCADAYGAATLCNGNSASGYNDWYLPSEGELKQMYIKLRKRGLGNFSNDYYWSSTEGIVDNTAQRILFMDGAIGTSTKSNLHKVRAVRNF
jgi:hypothetical protein